MPSWGQMRTTEVPLQTTSPSCLVSSVSFSWSSGSGKIMIVKTKGHKTRLKTECKHESKPGHVQDEIQLTGPLIDSCSGSDPYVLRCDVTIWNAHALQRHVVVHITSRSVYIIVIYLENSCPLDLPRIYSIVPSSTRFNRGSNPFRTPLAEREIHSLNLTQ